MSIDKMNVTQNSLTCTPPLFSHLTEKAPETIISRAYEEGADRI